MNSDRQTDNITHPVFSTPESLRYLLSVSKNIAKLAIEKADSKINNFSDNNKISKAEIASFVICASIAVGAGIAIQQTDQGATDYPTNIEDVAKVSVEIPGNAYSWAKSIFGLDYSYTD